MPSGLGVRPQEPQRPEASSFQRLTARAPPRQSRREKQGPEDHDDPSLRHPPVRGHLFPQFQETRPSVHPVSPGWPRQELSGALGTEQRTGTQSMPSCPCVPQASCSGTRVITVDKAAVTADLTAGIGDKLTNAHVI